MIIVQLFHWVCTAETLVGNRIEKYHYFKWVKRNSEFPNSENYWKKVTWDLGHYNYIFSILQIHRIFIISSSQWYEIFFKQSNKYWFVTWKKNKTKVVEYFIYVRHISRFWWYICCWIKQTVFLPKDFTYILWGKDKQ